MLTTALVRRARMADDQLSLVLEELKSTKFRLKPLENSASIAHKKLYQATLLETGAHASMIIFAKAFSEGISESISPYLACEAQTVWRGGRASCLWATASSWAST